MQFPEWELGFRCTCSPSLWIDCSRNPLHTWAITNTVQDAGANLEQLLVKAEAGEQVVIERAGKPAIRLAVVLLTETPAPRKERVLGQLRGFVTADAKIPIVPIEKSTTLLR